MRNIVLASLFIGLSAMSLHSQNKITVTKGYSPHIGTTVAMLEDLKDRVTRSVRNLDQKGTDFLLDDDANRVGALIYHLAATEKYYQLFTFEGRGFNGDEADWDLALSLGDRARKKLVGKPIDYYLKIWDDVRAETLRLLKTKDDKWFMDNTMGSNNMNNYWAWYHVMEHQANHMGQIRMITKRVD